MEWIDAKSSKPQVDTINQIYRNDDTSVRVLVWVDTYGPGFGRYYYHSARWSVEGINGLHNDRISHFTYIVEPKG